MRPIQIGKCTLNIKMGLFTNLSDMQSGQEVMKGPGSSRKMRFHTVW